MTDGAAAWLRRARPALGTWVEVGVPAGPRAEARVQAAFTALANAEARLSRFIASSEVGRFNALNIGEAVAIHPQTAALFRLADHLRQASEGLFDISLGSAPEGWALDGLVLRKTAATTRIDLGGIGKGQAVDEAIEALRGAGASAGWVNAGGDARAFGDVDLPIRLRDEASGGARPFALLRDGALATSHFGEGSRSALTGRAARVAHVSVAAPLCLWADALTKLVAVTGDTGHPLLALHQAQAWWHGPTERCDHGSTAVCA